MTNFGFDNLHAYEMVWTDYNGYVDTERPGGRRLFRTRHEIREWVYPDRGPRKQPIVSYRDDMERAQRRRRRLEQRCHEQRTYGFTRLRQRNWDNDSEGQPPSQRRRYDSPVRNEDGNHRRSLSPSRNRHHSSPPHNDPQGHPKGPLPVGHTLPPLMPTYEGGSGRPDSLHERGGENRWTH